MKSHDSTHLTQHTQKLSPWKNLSMMYWISLCSQIHSDKRHLDSLEIWSTPRCNSHLVHANHVSVEDLSLLVWRKRITVDLCQMPAITLSMSLLEQYRILQDSCKNFDAFSSVMDFRTTRSWDFHWAMIVLRTDCQENICRRISSEYRKRRGKQSQSMSASCRRSEEHKGMMRAEWPKQPFQRILPLLLCLQGILPLLLHRIYCIGWVLHGAAHSLFWLTGSKAQPWKCGAALQSVRSHLPFYVCPAWNKSSTALNQWQEDLRRHECDLVLPTAYVLLGFLDVRLEQIVDLCNDLQRTCHHTSVEMCCHLFMSHLRYSMCAVESILSNLSMTKFCTSVRPKSRTSWRGSIKSAQDISFLDVCPQKSYSQAEKRKKKQVQIPYSGAKHCQNNPAFAETGHSINVFMSHIQIFLMSYFSFDVSHDQCFHVSHLMWDIHAQCFHVSHLVWDIHDQCFHDSNLIRCSGASGTEKCRGIQSMFSHHIMFKQYMF